jgi:preprotein translocase SecE subunit
MTIALWGLFQNEHMRIFQTYIIESIEELRHVQWPTRKQAVRLSAIVLVFTLISSFVFGLLDFFLAQIVKALLSVTY